MTRYRDRADDRVYLGASLLNLNQPEQALQEARHAIRMEPRYATDVTPKRFTLGRGGQLLPPPCRSPRRTLRHPKTVQPLPGKESRWPLDIVPTSSTAATAPTFAEDAAQSLPHPAVEVSECGVVAMLEIFKPTFQGLVQIGDNDWQALPVGAPGLGPEHVDESDNPFDELASETRDQEIRF